MSLAEVIPIAMAAGAVLRNAFNQPGGPRGTQHHAVADEQAERLIQEQLSVLFPNDGYLGEELKSVRPCPAQSGRLWVVDPNDGTSAYMTGFRGSAVSIAMLEHGEPVLGVVYAFNWLDVLISRGETQPDPGLLVRCQPIQHTGQQWNRYHYRARARCVKQSLHPYPSNHKPLQTMEFHLDSNKTSKSYQRQAKQ